MRMEVGDGLKWILIVHRALQSRLRGPKVDDARDHQEYGERVDHRSIEVAAVRRDEVQNLREHRRDYDAQQEQESDIRQAAVEDKQAYRQFRQRPAARADEGTDEQNDEEND